MHPLGACTFAGRRAPAVYASRMARGDRRGWRKRAALAGVASVVLCAVAPPGASAAADPARMLTYMPTELVHSIHSRAEVEGYFAELGEYGIGQALLQMPRFNKKGKLKLPESNRQMLGVWSEAAAAYNLEHGASASVTAVFNAAIKPKGPNLESASTRSAMLQAIEATLQTGVGGVQLDIEPYPTGSGYVELLEEARAMFARVGWNGHLSVVAPGDNWTWSPSYLRRIGELVDQLDPTFYDTEYATVADYQELVEEGLAYYTANAPSTTAIIPVIPCYSPDPWHDPAIENVPSATAALARALEAGSRVDGAGLWWWYAFYYGHYKHGDAAAERAAWTAQTLPLPFSP